jgi:hypothetical protein
MWHQFVVHFSVSWCSGVAPVCGPLYGTSLWSTLAPVVVPGFYFFGVGGGRKIGGFSAELEFGLRRLLEAVTEVS